MNDALIRATYYPGHMRACAGLACNPLHSHLSTFPPSYPHALLEPGDKVTTPLGRPVFLPCSPVKLSCDSYTFMRYSYTVYPVENQSHLTVRRLAAGPLQLASAFNPPMGPHSTRGWWVGEVSCSPVTSYPLIFLESVAVSETCILRQRCLLGVPEVWLRAPPGYLLWCGRENCNSSTRSAAVGR